MDWLTQLMENNNGFFGATHSWSMKSLCSRLLLLLLLFPIGPSLWGEEEAPRSQYASASCFGVGDFGCSENEGTISNPFPWSQKKGLV
jgi:hypothetical protein